MSRLRGWGLLITACFLALAGCSRSFSAPTHDSTPVVVTVDQQQVAPRGFSGVHASGGTGPYTLALVDAQSGPDAQLFPDGGYQAGSLGNATDRVQATDAHGASGSATIRVGPPLQLSPGNGSVHPGESLTFLAQGGQPPYEFRLARHGKGSFGAISAAGVYTAGPNPDQTDLVEVLDRNQVSQVAQVSVLDTLLAGPVIQQVTPIRADVNGDGIDDLVVQSGAQLQVFIGTPTGPVAYDLVELPCAPLELRALDLNGDGPEDVIALCSDELLMLQGAFDGRLRAAPQWPWHIYPDAGAIIRDIEPLDLRAEGRPEALAMLLAVPPTGGAIVPTESVAIFTPPAGFTGELNPGPVSEVLEVPVDLSGLDLTGQLSAFSNAQLYTSGAGAVVVSPGISSKSLLLAIGAVKALDGGALAATGVRGDTDVSCAGKTPVRMGLAQFNSDRQGDLYAVVAPDANGVGAMCFAQGNSDGSFSTMTEYQGPLDLSTLHEVASEPGVPRVRLVDVAGDAGFEVDLATSPAGARSQSLPPDLLTIASGDFNGDGQADLVAVDAQNRLRLMPGDVEAGFRSGRTFYEAAQPVDTSAAYAPITHVGWAAQSGEPVGMAANRDGVRVFERSSTGWLAQRAHLLGGQRVDDLRVDPFGAWLLLANTVTRLEAAPDGGWTSASLAFSAHATRLGSELNAGGVHAGADLLLEADGTRHAVVIAPDGSLVDAPGDASVGATVGVAASGAAEDDLVQLQAGFTGNYGVYPPAGDGSPSWSSTPLFTVGPSDLGLDGGLLELRPFAFSRQVGTRADSALFVVNGDLFAYDFAQRHGSELGAGFDRDEEYPVAAADLDGDGLIDLVLTRASGPGLEIHIFLGQANGGFLERGFLAQGMQYMFPLAMDLDGDGRADLILFDDVHGQITALRSFNPDGGFGLY